MSEELRITEDGETRITEDGESRILENGIGDDGAQDMTFATNFASAHVSVGTIEIKFGGFGK